MRLPRPSHPSWGYQSIKLALDQPLVYLPAAVLAAATLSTTTGIDCSTTRGRIAKSICDKVGQLYTVVVYYLAKKNKPPVV